MPKKLAKKSIKRSVRRVVRNTSNKVAHESFKLTKVETQMSMSVIAFAIFGIAVSIALILGSTIKKLSVNEVRPAYTELTVSPMPSPRPSMRAVQRKDIIRTTEPVRAN